MRVLFSKRLLWLVLTIIFLLLGTVYVYGVFFNDTKKASETAQVEYGDVAQVVTVSGIVRANNAAALSFPTSGIVQSVLVDEGDQVAKGEILASLGQETLTAQYNSALANLRYEEAVLEELLEGPRSEAREVTETSVAIAREDLERTKAQYGLLVENARKVLLSSDLEAQPINKESGDIPPTISGSYACATEGQYTLTIYGSNSRSGYSYRLSGLEEGTFSAYTEKPAPLGSCGLYIQFDENEFYRSEDWIIEIPNTRSASYVTNKNAYDVAVRNRDNAVEAAQQALELAQEKQALENAKPRTEAEERAEARVDQARAQLATIEAQIADKTIRAPFDGVVTNVDIKIGEVGGMQHAITMIKDDEYEVKVRIPEIDITKVTTDDRASITFDANEDVTVQGNIGFISPLSTEIDGVAYYEANLLFEEKPAWMREGLNADIDIIVDERKNVPTLPSRFIVKENGGHAVFTETPQGKVLRPVSLGLIGNEGVVEVLDLSLGTTVIAP